MLLLVRHLRFSSRTVSISASDHLPARFGDNGRKRRMLLIAKLALRELFVDQFLVGIQPIGASAMKPPSAAIQSACGSPWEFAAARRSQQHTARPSTIGRTIRAANVS